MDQIWWVVEVSGKYLGKVKATEQEIRAALGPHVEITGNCANVYGPPGIAIHSESGQKSTERSLT